MIQFYKPNPKVTGTACSFWLNEDGSIMSSMIKQDSWNDQKRIGSFSKNKGNPQKSVIVKFSPSELGGIIDAMERNESFSAYHSSKDQITKINFGPYVSKKDNKQVGFSYSINKEEKQDSTNKIGFVIGFNFGEGRYLKEFLLEVLRGGFDWRDSTDKPQNNQRTIGFNTGVNEPSSSEDEEDIW